MKQTNLELNMGEYAEMMLDGTCCCSCGEFIGDGDGYPVYCAGCEMDLQQIEKAKKPSKVKLKKILPCTHEGCARKFANDEAVKQHLHHFHGQRNVFIK